MWCCYWVSLAVTQKTDRQGRRQEGSRRWLYLWEGECLHTGHSRGAHVLSSEMQAHLPVTLEEGKKWEGGGREKNMHWTVANYSHRNLTLADWLQPRSRRFCTWNCARCYFWDMTWWRNPRGSDRSRTLIQNTAPHPPHCFLCPPSISPSHFSDCKTKASLT